MTRPDVMVRVVWPHDWTLGPDCHEWVSLGERVKANRLMVPNPRMYLPTATKWICNNPNCSAWAMVSDAWIKKVLSVVEGALSDQHPAEVSMDADEGVEEMVRITLGHIERIRSGDPAGG